MARELGADLDHLDTAHNPRSTMRRQTGIVISVPVADTASPPGGKLVATTVRLDTERHDELRTLAFNARRCMHSLLLEGVDLVLAKHRKG